MQRQRVNFETVLFFSNPLANPSTPCLKISRSVLGYYLNFDQVIYQSEKHITEYLNTIIQLKYASIQIKAENHLKYQAEHFQNPIISV